MEARLEIRLPEEMKVDVEKRARRAGMTVSEFVRYLINGCPGVEGESTGTSQPDEVPKRVEASPKGHDTHVRLKHSGPAKVKVLPGCLGPLAHEAGTCHCHKRQR